MSRALRIACVISSLGPGGAERVLALLASTWATRHHVSVLTFAAAEAPVFHALGGGVRHVPLGVAGTSTGPLEAIANNARRLRVLRAALRQEAPDVVVSFVDQTNVTTLLAALGTGLPIIAAERTNPGAHRIGPVWRALRVVTYPLAARVVVQTVRVRRQFERWPRPRLTVIANPVVVPPDAGTADRRAPEFVAAGRLVPSKATDLVVRAFASLAADLPAWRLTILGDGPERGALETLAVELGVAARVTFCGLVPDTRPFLERAAVFVTASRYEGFPNALAEAMAAGCAVVATDCETGPRELTADGAAGLLVPVDDVAGLVSAMRRLGLDADVRRQFAAAARRAVLGYDVAHVAGTWERLLRDVVDGVGTAGEVEER